MKSALPQKEPAETIWPGLPLNIEHQAVLVGHHSSHTIHPNIHTRWMPGHQGLLEQTEHQPTDLAKLFPLSPLSPLSRTLSSNSLPKFGWVQDAEGGLLVVSVGPSTIVLNLYACPLPADHLLTLVRYNLYRACAANAKILGLDPRSLHDDITSPFCDLKTFDHLLPKPLIPTETQILVRHHPYIDLFPLGSLRDKLILSEGTIDEDELCADLGGKNSTTEHTGLIVWGDSWDPMGWELSEYVAIKWGWLFEGCEELLIATDYWRRQRGEASLMDALFRS
jgi:hypothetical protein